MGTKTQVTIVSENFVLSPTKGTPSVPEKSFMEPVCKQHKISDRP